MAAAGRAPRDIEILFVAFGYVKNPNVGEVGGF
jgi:hypothetical protein